MRLPELRDVDLDPAISETIDHKLALKHSLLFARHEGQDVVIVRQESLADALNHLATIDHGYDGKDYPVYLTDDESFTRLRNKFLEIQTGSAFEEMEAASEELFEAESDLLEFIQNSQDLLNSEESAPIIKLVNSLFFQAIKRGASDIHIEAHERRGEVRFRINGALIKHLDLDKNVTTLVVNRIKVISGLDISEKRVPQDGRTQVTISGKTLDVRVSVLPTYYGERIVMRILMQSENIPSLEELGFQKELTEQLHDFTAARRIQVPGRLIRQQHLRVGHQCPGNGNTLLLPTGQFARRMVFPAIQPHQLQCPSSFGMALRTFHASVHQWQFNVFQRGRSG